MAFDKLLRNRGLALPALRQARADATARHRDPARRSLRFYLIKPSRYDDDGWVMRYRWGVIPNNTLTAVAGLLAQCAADLDVAIETILWDELVDGVVTAEVITSIHQRARADGVELLIGLAGVQTSQYPRARDIALQFRRLDATVVIGGFHVSSHPASTDFLCRHGITVVIGEAENTLGRLLDDYLHGTLQAQYRVTSGIVARTGSGSITVPAVDATALPALDDRYASRFFNPTFATIDTSRGCPFACSYCSVKNVMGRTMRPRDPQRVVEWVRDAHDHHGVRNLLVVDDDLFRSPSWEPLFLGLAALRRDGRSVSLIIQTDIESAAHGATPAGTSVPRVEERSRRFVDLAAAAGCFEVFMGFESFAPANLEQTLKFHNQDRTARKQPCDDAKRATERVKARYRRVVDNWHSAGVGVHCGYMIGLPFDELGCGASAARDLAEIGVDIASFFACTPLPGTEDHDRAVAGGAITEDDFNAYDSTHFVAHHPRLSVTELQREYADAYRTFYSWRRLAWSLATVHGMPGLSRSSRFGMLAQQFYFTYATRRGWHPMMGGIGRLREGPRREVVADADAAALYLARSPGAAPAGTPAPPIAVIGSAATRGQSSV